MNSELLKLVSLGKSVTLQIDTKGLPEDILNAMLTGKFYKQVLINALSSSFRPLE